jgi:hypothetical protein
VVTAVAETPVERLNFWREKRAKREQELREAKGHWFASCTKSNALRYEMAKRALGRADAELRKAEEEARGGRPIRAGIRVVS